MKQHDNKTKTDAAANAKATRKGKAITADRATKSEQAASRKHLSKLKKLFGAWLDARQSGAAESLLETGSEWQKMLQSVGLSIIDGRQDVGSEALQAVATIDARYNAAKAETARKAPQKVVSIITTGAEHQYVPVDDALSPLVKSVDPAQVWADYNAKVRTVPSNKCKLVDILPFVSARSALTVAEIEARLPEDKRKAAGDIHRKVLSVLRCKSKAYAAFSSAELQSVKARGSAVVHSLQVTYSDGASEKIG